MIYFSSLLILTIVHLSNCDDDFSKSKPTPTPFHDWDYIVYSQRWPVTGCSQWKERSPSNTCNMPENNSTWTVHGVWPTKIGTNGPYFCNSAIHFDPDQLEPMMKELLEFWPNIEANTKPNSFWKHEWNKHGTCASTLPQLNSVTNFFKQGLQWNQDYNLATILTKNEIVPNQQGYNISDIYNAIKTTINKNPTVECVVDGKSKQSLISEIHICFNKSLDLIDCNITKQQEGDILSNCNGKDNVMYFATIPNNTLFTRSKNHADFGGSVDATVEECLQNDFYEKNLLKLYSLVKFLIWFTL